MNLFVHFRNLPWRRKMISMCFHKFNTYMAGCTYNLVFVYSVLHDLQKNNHIKKYWISNIFSWHWQTNTIISSVHK
jgi:hypothetical protein